MPTTFLPAGRIWWQGLVARARHEASGVDAVGDDEESWRGRPRWTSSFLMPSQMPISASIFFASAVSARLDRDVMR